MSVSTDDKDLTTVSAKETTSKGLSIDDIYKALSEDDPKEDLLGDEKNVSETKSEGDASEEGTETSLEEDGDDESKGQESADEEIITPVRLKAIESKYPELFKEFPHLKVAYQRDRQFAEIFPTVDDAREASEKAETFSRFEGDLLSGNPQSLLQSIQKSDPDSFANLVDNLLPALQKVDQAAYFNILGNTAKSYISSMIKQARQESNEELGQAAVTFHKWLFGGANWTEPTNYGKGVQEKKEVSTERQQFLQERYEIVSEEVDRTCTNALKSTIDINIDPKGVMTAYIKKNAVRDALEMTETALSKDKEVQRVMQKLWQDAERNGYKKQYIDAIKSRYKAYAKPLLQVNIGKARNEALKAVGKRASEPKEEPVEHIDTPRPRQSSRSDSNNPFEALTKKLGRKPTTREFLDAE